MQTPVVRFFPWLIGLFALCACGGARPSPGVNTELGCGLGGYASQAPVLRRATLPEPSVRGASSALLVEAYDARGGAPIRNLRVQLTRQADSVTRQTTVDGFALFQPVVAGPALLEARLFNFLPWRDSIRLRAGFVDTMELHLGRMGNECLIVPKRAGAEAGRA